jgi:hypothetical protein
VKGSARPGPVQLQEGPLPRTYLRSADTSGPRLNARPVLARSRTLPAGRGFLLEPRGAFFVITEPGRAPLADVTRRQSFLASAACGAALSLLGPAARAAAPVRLAYQAPAGCPTQSGFEAAVRARGTSLGARAAATGAAGEGERWLQVVIEQHASGFTGALQVRDGEQTSERREVHGPSCAEVSDALAVVTAIALSADANPLPVVGSVPANSPGANSPTAAAPAASSLAAAPAVAVPSAPPAAPERSVHVLRWSDSVDVPAGKLGFEQLRGYTLSAGAALGVIPGVTLPRFDFAVTSASLVKTPGDADYLLGGFRIRWSFLGVGTHRSPGFSTGVWGIKAGFGGCGALLYDPRGLILSICPEIAAGAMAVETKDDATGSVTQNKTVGIGTASLELASQYNIGSLFHLDLHAGGEMWVGKLTAERPDGTRLFESSTFNAYLLAGLGLHF